MRFPKIDCCVVCEGIRQEIMNKFVLLGFFGITPHVQLTIKDFKIPVSFCFIGDVGGSTGHHSKGPGFVFPQKPETGSRS